MSHFSFGEWDFFLKEYLLLLQFDNFLYLFFKVWSKDFLSYAFFYLINAPETSSVQFVAGLYFTVVDRFVHEDQFLFAGRFEDVTCPPTEVSHFPGCMSFHSGRFCRYSSPLELNT